MYRKPVHIIGAGGIGVSLAWCLSRSPCDITLVETNPRKLEHASRHGLTVEGAGTAFVPFVAFDDWIPPDEGYVLLCTKTYDNPAIIEKLRNRSSCLLPVQNGVDAQLEALGHAGEGIVSFVSNCEPDRPVTRITRAGALHIGMRRPGTAQERTGIALLAQALDEARLFKVKLVDDVRPFKSTKLMYNAAISPLSSAADMTVGDLLDHGLAQRLFFGLIQENHRILKASGAPLGRIGPFHPDTVSLILRVPLLPEIFSAFFRRSLKGTYCSMSSDIFSGRTEIEAYNGYLIALAGSTPCPFNRAAYDLVEAISLGQRVPGRANLEWFENRLGRNRH